MRRLASLVLVAGAVLLLAGCRTDAFLEVQVDADGGGAVYVAVALDQEAASRSLLYETLDGNLLPVEDLVRAGWRVSGPAQEQDGRVWVRAEKEFSQLDQLGTVVEEVAGPDGPFRDFRVDRSSSFGERNWQFSGTVDLTQGLAAFSDDAVAGAFGGEALGQPAEAFSQALGAPLESAVTMNVVVNLPGELGQHNGVVGSAGQAVPTTLGGATTAVEATVADDGGRMPTRGAAVVWTPSFADAAPSELQADSSSSQLLPRIWRWVGLLVGLIGLSVLAYRLGQLWLDQRRDRRRGMSRLGGGRGALLPGRRAAAAPVPPGPASATTPPPAATVMPPPPAATVMPPAPGAPAAAEDDAGSARAGAALQLIVIETTGALLAVGDPVGEVLVPFCRERNCNASVRRIAELHRNRVVGAVSADEFWDGLGVVGDPVLLDDAFARRFDLTDHVEDFLRQARRREVMVAAVGDDVPEWIAVYRQRFKLDGLIGWWVPSAEVGVRVPHPGLLENVARLTTVPPARAMVIASTRSLLDTAGRLGFRTVHYNPGPDDPDSRHPVLRTFAGRGRPAASSAASG